MLASRQSMTAMSLVSSQFRHQKSAVIHPYWTFIRDRGTYQKKSAFQKEPIPYKYALSSCACLLSSTRSVFSKHLHLKI